MRIALTKPLFAWEELEDSPSLATLGELLRTLPDGRLLASLRQARGKGRDDYPVHVLWGVVVLSIACRHSDMEASIPTDEPIAAPLLPHVSSSTTQTAPRG